MTTPSSRPGHAGPGPAALGALALLRTAGVLYLGAWVMAAVAPPGHPLRGLGAALLAPLAPAVLAVVLGGMLARRGWGLRTAPFTAAAVAVTAAVVAADAAGVPPAAIAAGALAAVGAAAHLLAAPAPRTGAGQDPGGGHLSASTAGGMAPIRPHAGSSASYGRTAGSRQVT